MPGGTLTMRKMFVTIGCAAAWSVLVFGQDVIRGTYSYTYGDRESLVEARQACKTLAIRDAIESYYLYVESSSTVENNTLKNDIVESLAAGHLKNVRTLDQKEEGRTVTITVEADVDPADIRALVEKKIGGASSPPADASSVKSGVNPPLDFTVFLSKIENRAISAERELDQNRFDQALVRLQDMDTLLASFPDQSNDRFQTLMMKSLSQRNRILADLARLERVRSGRRGIRERAAERAIRTKFSQMESGLSELRSLTGLTEKQMAIRSDWFFKCRQLGSKLKKILG
jgi:hypothetical protein